MADNQLKFILDFVAKTAGLSDAAGLAGKLGDELDDAGGAGKQMAAALKAAADKAQQELDDTIALADELGRALGPELTARVNVDEIAGKMQAAGVSIEDVKANADDFRTSLEKMADTADQAKGRMGDLDTSVQRVGDTADRSSSVMANFAGNAAQEIPGLTGAFAPLNMAIGQFVEYGAEGNINLKGLAAQAGPMAGIGAAIWYANNQLEIMKKKDAFHTERVKGYEGAIKKSGDAVQNLADHLRDVGKIEATTWGNNANPFADATVDITQKVADAGLTVEQYSQLLVDGKDAIRAWADAQIAAGNDVPGDLFITMMQDAKDYASAQDRAAESARFFGVDLGTLAEQAEKADRKQRTLNDALVGFSHQWDILNDKINADDTFAAAIAAIHDTEAAVNDQKRAVNEYLQEVLRLPASVGTKFDALIDDGNMEEVERRLNWLARTREALIWQTVVDKNSHYVPGQGEMKAFASGTASAPGGPSVLHAGELVTLPAGARVDTAERTQQLMSRPSGPTAGEAAIIAAINASAKATARAVVQAMRAA